MAGMNNFVRGRNGEPLSKLDSRLTSDLASRASAAAHAKVRPGSLGRPSSIQPDKPSSNSTPILQPHAYSPEKKELLREEFGHEVHPGRDTEPFLTFDEHGRSDPLSPSQGSPLKQKHGLFDDSDVESDMENTIVSQTEFRRVENYSDGYHDKKATFTGQQYPYQRNDSRGFSKLQGLLNDPDSMNFIMNAGGNMKGHSELRNAHFDDHRTEATPPLGGFQKERDQHEKPRRTTKTANSADSVPHLKQRPKEPEIRKSVDAVNNSRQSKQEPEFEPNPPVNDALNDRYLHGTEEHENRPSNIYQLHGYNEYQRGLHGERHGRLAGYFGERTNSPGLVDLESSDGEQTTPRGKTLKDVLNTISGGSSGIKRDAEELDYDVIALRTMKFSELKEQPFEFNPKPIASVVPEFLSRPNVTLEDRLNHFADQPPDLQAQFFALMSREDWDEAGDWMLDGFGRIISELKTARTERRKICKTFEQDLATREEAVQGKIEDIDQVLAEMKQGGLGVLRMKSLRG